jgi:RNA polymerase sigma factor (sigma-70 family)
MTGEEPSDLVVHAAVAGAPWALEQIWSELSPAVNGYLASQGCREPDDVTSEVFVQVFSGIGRFTGSWASLRSWVFTIAHHRMIDERRRRSVRVVEPVGDLDDDDALVAPDAADAALVTVATERVQELCERLGPDQRDVLLLRLVAGLTVDEVADTVGRSAGAVKQLQRRGLLALRAILEAEGVTL